MAVGEGELLGVVDKLYRAALEPAGWGEALESLSSVLGGAGAVLVPLTRPEALIASSSMGEPAEAYTRHWSLVDPRAKAAFDRRLGPGVFTDPDLVTSEEMARDPFYQEFLRSFDLEYFASFGFLSETATKGLVSLSVQRRRGKGPFQSDDLALLSTLGPHASRAFTIFERLGAPPRPLDADLEAFLHRLSCGAIAVARTGRVVAVNAVAGRLLGDGLAIERARLVAAAPGAQTSLDQMLSRVFDAPLRGAETLALPRPSGARPLLLQAMPLSLDYAPGCFGKRPAMALTLVLDTEKSRGADASAAFAALGLTPAEVAVARLIGAGDTPREASDQLRLSVETVRTHLKNINQKLGFRRQSDLVALAARLGMTQ